MSIIPGQLSIPYTAADDAKLAGIDDGAETNPPIATQAEAVAGTDDTTMMTPLKVLESIQANASGGGIDALTGDVTASGTGSVATTVAAIQGTSISGTTGSGNVVLSASPTITGTLTAATVSASSTISGSNLTSLGHASADLALAGGTMSGDINMGGQRVTVMSDPSSSSDAATKNYVDVTSVPLSSGNAPGGYPILDGGGKVPYAQLPSALMTFKGAWDASSNTPTLADGIGNSGDTYRASAAGTQNLGSGSQTWAIGDFVIYNGTIWQHSPAADGVVSVNGATGGVTVNAINQLSGDVITSLASQSQAEAATIAKIQGTTVSGTTGTVNVMFSASPTTTGTLTAAAISASGSITASNISGTNTGDQTITLTGDVTGTGTGSFSTTISALAITPSKLNTITDGITLDQSGSGSTLEVKALGIDTAQLAATSVTIAKLNTITDNITLDQNGVNSSLEIKNLGVGTTQLSANAVTIAKLATITDGITLDQSGFGSSLEIKPGGVTTTQIGAEAVNLGTQVSSVLPIANGGTNSSIALANGSVMISASGSIIETPNLLWDNTNNHLSINQPSVAGSGISVLTLTSDPSGNFGHGDHLEIAGNPGGGGTIFRTDGGTNVSWLQFFGGDSDSTGAQFYVNGNNTTDGDAGGVQFVMGLSRAYFQVLDHTISVPLFTVTDSGGNGTVNIPSLTTSTVVVTDGSSNLASSLTTATEIGYVSGVTSSIQTQLNAISTPQTPTQNQYYYVSGNNGDDTVGDGTYNKPFATIAKAMGLITTAASNNRFLIKIMSSKLQEPTDIALKPFVYIVGDSSDGTYIRINGGSGSVVPDASWATVGGGRCGIENVYLGGGSNINWDLYSIGPNTGTPSCNLTLTNVVVTGNFVYNGRVPDIDFTVAYTCYFFGTTNFDATQASSISSIFQGDVTLSATNAGANSQFVGCSFLGNVIITASGSNTNIEQINSSAINGTITLTDSASFITLISDSSSYPVHSKISITGSPTITLLSDAYGTSYTPTTSADWTTIPATVQSALDILAASSGGSTTSTTLSNTYKNNSGSTIGALSIVSQDSSGNLIVALPSVEQDVLNIVGVIVSSLTTGSSGAVTLKGLTQNITTSFVLGNVLYLNTDGTLTTSVPDIGVGAFTTGDFVVRIGQITKNASNPSNLDLLVDVAIVGQL